ncbi:sulfite exporter TauE/SafE family protein [Halobacteriovorax sp. JY17]|uniref:sulfite exporter TauE/SafE family protein n=1 Tax=Halobacteriovorax sp. JY17 TaxID=2014617 RepID=UPI000C433C16|nr:sulfite exporter TauE/SafE family protein [Halobacteriovorax sp. JY17]PIK16413.1 MAG: permease [Halobacteriovorax sp. JY17]
MIGYILAILIGLSLGLLGGGGSILTVPILVYVMKMDAKLAIALSLAIVGMTSLIGVIPHFKNKNVDLKMVLIFGPFAMVGTFGGAKISQFISGQSQLIFFAIIMIIAAFFMFRGREEVERATLEKNSSKKDLFFLALQGIFVGIITGVVGVGGGFLIVPALVLLAKSPMKKAVGTSLLLIALNSLTGFMGYLDQVTVPWEFLFKFSSCSIVGIFIGSYLVRFISQNTLKKGFAIFLILMGLFILYKNKETLISKSSMFTVKVQGIYA